jgi:hypothetical protein
MAANSSAMPLFCGGFIADFIFPPPSRFGNAVRFALVHARRRGSVLSVLKVARRATFLGVPL